MIEHADSSISKRLLRRRPFASSMKKDKSPPLQQSTSLARSLYRGELSAGNSTSFAIPRTRVSRYRSRAALFRLLIIGVPRARGGKRISEKNRRSVQEVGGRGGGGGGRRSGEENDAAESPMGNIIFLTTAIGRPILAMNFDRRPPRPYRS